MSAAKSGVELGAGYGTEPGKTRPVLIVQAQALLSREHPSTLVLPLTTQLNDQGEPLRIRVAPSGLLPHRLRPANRPVARNR